MTNEELVALIQAGERDKLEELWQNVERFVWQQAGRRTLRGVSMEDLCQSGFLALVTAVDKYDAERGMSFIGFFSMTLRTAFNAAAGLRTERQRRDPLHQAVSMDAQIQDTDGLSMAEGLEDPGAAMEFDFIDFDDFLPRCRKVIDAALASLPDGQGELLRSYYLRRQGIEAAAVAAGYCSRASAYGAIERALYHLAHGKYARTLRECLDTFNELEECRTAARSTGIGSYQRTGSSATEAGALLR